MQPTSEPPWPLVEMAIEPKSKTDREKLSVALSALAAQDPSFRVTTDAESGQTILGGLSEAHLEFHVDILRRINKVDANIGAPQVAYRETLSRRVARTEWHAKGNPLEATRVTMVFDPLPSGSGNRFLHRDDISSIPAHAVEAVQTAVDRASRAGVLAGFPVVDIQATVVDAEWPGTGSRTESFGSAALTATRYALCQASVLLEPIMTVEVVTPEDYEGSVIGDLTSRRGHITAREFRAGAHVISASVPLTNMFGYVHQLRSFSQGRATFTMQFDRYATVIPPQGFQPPPAAAAALRA